MVGHYSENTRYSGLPGAVIAHSYDAVALFFVLSGFVLAMVYGDSVGLPAGRRPFRRFLSHRLARIYPLYVATTVLSLVMARAGVAIYGDPTTSAPAVLSNLLMVQSWGWPIDSLNGPGWSISTEWAANLMFPAFALVMLRWPMRRSAVLAAAAMVILVGSAAMAHGQYWGMPILTEARPFRLSQPLLACPMEFMLGMFCWRLRQEARWTMSLGRGGVQAAIVAAMLGWMTTTADDAWFVGLACLLVIGLSLETSAIARLLTLRGAHWLGAISFSIYLVHAPLLPLVPGLATLLEGTGVAHAWSLSKLLTMVCAIGVAGLSYRFLEQPARRALRRVLDPPAGVSRAAR